MCAAYELELRKSKKIIPIDDHFISVVVPDFNEKKSVLSVSFIELSSFVNLVIVLLYSTSWYSISCISIWFYIASQERRFVCVNRKCFFSHKEENLRWLYGCTCTPHENAFIKSLSLDTDYVQEGNFSIVSVFFNNKDNIIIQMYTTKGGEL